MSTWDIIKFVIAILVVFWLLFLLFYGFYQAAKFRREARRLKQELSRRITKQHGTATILILTDRDLIDRRDRPDRPRVNDFIVSNTTLVASADLVAYWRVGASGYIDADDFLSLIECYYTKSQVVGNG